MIFEKYYSLLVAYKIFFTITECKVINVTADNVSYELTEWDLRKNMTNESENAKSNKNVFNNNSRKSVKHSTSREDIQNMVVRKLDEKSKLVLKALLMLQNKSLPIQPIPHKLKAILATSSKVTNLFNPIKDNTKSTEKSLSASLRANEINRVPVTAKANLKNGLKSVSKEKNTSGNGQISVPYSVNQKIFDDNGKSKTKATELSSINIASESLEEETDIKKRNKERNMVLPVMQTRVTEKQPLRMREWANFENEAPRTVEDRVGRMGPLPSPEILDMAAAKGSHVSAKRLKGRLCHRHVLLPEGPKYDSAGRAYVGAHGGGGGEGWRFERTRRPHLLLPSCCNCCKKSVLGCE